MLTEAAAIPTGARVIAPDGSMSYAELDERSRRLATGLARLGVAGGDAVAVWLPNVAAWLELEFALARLGAVAVAVNTRFGPHELQQLLARSRSRVLVCGGEAERSGHGEVLGQLDWPALPYLAAVVHLSGTSAPLPSDVRAVPYRELLAQPALHEDQSGAPTPCNVFTSSGTTASPKLVVHHQAAIAAHSRAVGSCFGYEASDAVILAMLPLCGVFGFNTALAAIAAAASLVLLPGFTAELAVDAIARHGVTHTNGTDEMVRRILAVAGEAPQRLDSLRDVGFASFGGEPEALVAAGDRFGVRLRGVYGSSEVQALIARADGAAQRRAIAGGSLVSEQINIRIRDPGTGALVGTGQLGALEIRGPNIMTGYLDDPQASADVFTDDGFLRTGDLAELEPGGRGFRYVARQNDALRLGGYLVSPREIEAFIEDLDGVIAAQVVAVDVAGAARPFAFIRSADGFSCDEAAIRAACAARLARYKIPVRVVCVDSFPTTPSANGERVQRAVLRQRAASLLAAERSEGR
jgi:fatty-acyl-CoA synthase